MTNSIKFYYNGIRVNGERTLIKTSYNIDKQSGNVMIYADSYGNSLPRDVFEVHNDTDSYTDYFDKDHAVLTPDHPLYKYAYYAAVKAVLRYMPKHIKYLESCRYTTPAEIEAKKVQMAEYQAMKDPGQPTQADLDTINQLRQEAENARIAAELEAEQKAREEVLAQKNRGRWYIEEIAKSHPIREGEPVVTINWSENPAFYNWKDDELKLSVAAAEIILKHFDEEVHAEKDRGYDKTKFTIEYVNEDGEQDTYTGRYDLGDNDGGMIEHIRGFGRFYVEKGNFGNGVVTDEDRETGAQIMAFADMLAGCIEKNRGVDVKLAPWAAEFLKKRKAVNAMTNDEIMAAVLMIDFDDEERRKEAEELLKALAKRDVNAAVETYRLWKEMSK